MLNVCGGDDAVGAPPAGERAAGRLVGRGTIISGVITTRMTSDLGGDGAMRTGGKRTGGGATQLLVLMTSAMSGAEQDHCCLDSNVQRCYNYNPETNLFVPSLALDTGLPASS